MTDFHPMTDPWVGQLYGRHSHPLNRTLSREGIEMVARTHSGQLAAIGVDVAALASMNILECGGTGRDALAWAHLGARRVTHVDISRENCDRLQAYCKDAGIGNLRVRFGDILAIELPQNAHDIVRSRGVVHHLAVPALGIARYVAWAKLGGLVHFNLYRGGTFYYFCIKILRHLAKDLPVEAVMAAGERAGLAREQVGICVDDLYVPYMHTASYAAVRHDLNRLGLEELWPKRHFTELDHDLRYPDMPEKTEHLQWWLRKTRPHEPPQAVVDRLCYHRGIDDIAAARALPEAAATLDAFHRLDAATAPRPAETRADVVVRLYRAAHFEIATVAMTGQERHARLTAKMAELLPG